MLCSPPVAIGPRRAVARANGVAAVTGRAVARVGVVRVRVVRAVPARVGVVRVGVVRDEVARVGVAVPATTTGCRGEPADGRRAPRTVGVPRLGRAGAASFGSASLLRDRSLGSAGRGRVLEANASAFAFAR